MSTAIANKFSENKLVEAPVSSDQYKQDIEALLKIEEDLLTEIKNNQKYGRTAEKAHSTAAYREALTFRYEIEERHLKLQKHQLKLLKRQKKLEQKAAQNNLG